MRGSTASAPVGLVTVAMVSGMPRTVVMLMKHFDTARNCTLQLSMSFL